MGARIPPSDRPRRGGISCEFCGRAVPSASALESHQAALHSQALKEKAKAKPAATKPAKGQKPEQRKVSLTNANLKDKGEKDKIEAVVSKTPQKKHPVEQNSSKAPTAEPKTDAAKAKPDNTKPKTLTTRTKLEKSVTKVEETLITPAMEGKKNSAITKLAKRRKVEYKCPKCEKLFPVLFVAQKHIQKHHCVNDKDEKVAENSPDIIQPILLELCIYCNEKFAKPHNCPNRPDNLQMYECLGCQHQFNNNKLFDLHVANVHGDQLESLFFPNEEEFVTWKEEMESQTACKFVLMGKYNSKQIYQCSEYTDNTELILLLCPASFVVTKYPKGFQIHFYPCHYEHKYEEYELKDQYKTFTITDIINQAGFPNGSSEEDLYLQFKTLMETIVLDAAKINIDMLKTLITRAKDMQAILQDYDEDKEIDMVKGQFTISLSTRSASKSDDSQSTESLPTSTRNRKRTIEEENGTALKKSKTTVYTKTPIKSIGKKSFSLADGKDSDKILKELDSRNAQTREKSMQSPSFTDAYKDFIMNASKNPIGKKKTIVKTKMGQFKGPSPKKIVKRHSIGSNKDIEYEVRERDEECNILVLKI